MRSRPLLLLSALAVLGLLVPLSLYAYSTRPDLESFLSARKSLLARLDANAAALPKGFEHVIPPYPSSHFPPEGHIRSVVRGGQVWFGDNHTSYDLKITDDADRASAKAAVIELFEHLQDGTEESGLSSPKSGGPDWIVEKDRRAAHSRHWRDPGHHLIVTLSVVVDLDSKSAHVTRYLHERFE